MAIATGTALALGAAGNVASGYMASRAAGKAGKQTQRGIQGAIDAQRDPGSILKDFYGSEGMFGSDAMSALLGREKELIPQFQELSRLKATGIRDIQEDSKVRQLGLIGQYGDDIRETLEDPRLRGLAQTEIDEAERLTGEARSPLQGERARQAEQTALSGAVRQGRGRGESAVAQLILGRSGASDVLSNQAAQARQRARSAVGATKVDPYQFLFGSPSAEEQIYSQTPLGAIVTDPGQAINLGMAQDLNLGNMRMGKNQVQAQTTAAQGRILGDTVSSIGNLAMQGIQPGNDGGFNFGNLGFNLGNARNILNFGQNRGAGSTTAGSVAGTGGFYNADGSYQMPDFQVQYNRR